MEFILESEDESGSGSASLSSSLHSVVSESHQEEFGATYDLKSDVTSSEDDEDPRRRHRRRSQSEGSISPEDPLRGFIPRTPSLSSIDSIESPSGKRAQGIGGMRVTKPVSSTPVRKSIRRVATRVGDGSTQELIREALQDSAVVDDSTASLIAFEKEDEQRPQIRANDDIIRIPVQQQIDSEKSSPEKRLVQTNQPLLTSSGGDDEDDESAEKRAKRLEVVAQRSEAQREVGNVDDARKKLSLEEALQKDRRAILHTVYERCRRDIHEKERNKKKVVIRTPCNSLKSRGKKTSHVAVKSKPVGSPYLQKQVQTRLPWKPTRTSLLTRKKVSVGDCDLLPLLAEEFPYLHVSPATVQQMWRKQMHQIHVIAKAEINRHKRPKAQTELEEAELKQRTLLQVMKKDLEHNKRIREKKEREFQLRYVKSQLKDKRQSVIRAKQYYEKYVERMRSRQMKRKTREEQIFKNLFEDGLEIQKARLRDLREYAKEKRAEQAQRQKSEIESLENYYRDQFGMLAQSMAEERRELHLREEAQSKAVAKMRRELRKRVEKEIEDLQEAMIRDEDDAYFREIDANRLRDRLLMARFNTKI
ncbi:centrosomal protein of 95 kDa-like isoform X2 [Oscarella lobularis]|uniref:centrosomal protein of 95 kDa-like isoform X2 n=1 Tax=Oscarella lobularis TaxID=121494 RepID=UPI003313C4C8